MLGRKELKEIVDVGIALTTEKNKNKLWEMILAKAMKLSNCDAGTLYLYQDEKLHFKIMKTISQGVNRGANGEKINLPPVPLTEGQVCSYSAIHNELVNIPDVYHSDQFDFSGPKKYDSITGYRTQSMIVIPMMDTEEQLVGVLQLMNAQDEDGNVIPFTQDEEFVLRSLASQAAVSVSNMLYVEEIKRQLYSFAAALATAIDQRTPYNGSHTRMVAAYAEILADYINEKYYAGECDDFFDENRKEQLVLAAALHDIGKMIVPLSVMNKATRLDKNLPILEARYELIETCLEVDLLKNKINQEEYRQKVQYLKDSLDFIHSIDSAGFMPDENMEKVKEIAEHFFEKEDGTVIPYLTDYELECLSVRRGTLTDTERELMESHVVMTGKILEKVHFNAHYANVAKFAASHHELLNGTGYPNHISGEDLDLESKILAVVDVYDALTATDRPYKKPMPKEKAFSVLHAMVEEGKMEERLVVWLEESIKDMTTEEIIQRQLF